MNGLIIGVIIIVIALIMYFLVDDKKLQRISAIASILGIAVSLYGLYLQVYDEKEAKTEAVINFDLPNLTPTSNCSLASSQYIDCVDCNGTGLWDASESCETCAYNNLLAAQAGIFYDPDTCANRANHIRISEMFGIKNGIVGTKCITCNGNGTVSNPDYGKK